MSRFARLFAVLCTLAPLVFAADPRPFQATPDDRHKVRVTDPMSARLLKDQGATLVAQYETFSVFELNAAGVQKMAHDPAIETADEWFHIELNAGAIDARAPTATAERQAAAAAVGGKRLHLVQFAGPPQQGWLDELQADGWQVVCYVPENSYVVYGDAQARRQLTAGRAARSHVQWEGALLADEKIHPRARAFDEAGQPRAAGLDAYSLQLVADPEANATTLKLIDGVKLAPLISQKELPPYLNVIVRLPAAAVANLAAQPDVLSIHAYVEPQMLCERQGMIVSGNLIGNAPSGPGYLNWLYSKGFTKSQFTAAGFVVDVTDSAIGNGSTNENHFGLRLQGDLGQVSRVAYNQVEGTGGASGGQGCDGHGNLNAHIIAGYTVSNGTPHVDGAGYHYGLGICPFVRVGASTIFDPRYTNPDYENLISRAYRDGARISSDSWGASTGGDYDLSCQQYDALVRDAQPTASAVPVAGNQEMTIVFAAGNAGPGSATVGSPSGGKNVLTVGAAENVHPFGGADGSGIDDTGANSVADMIYFSSRGPCQDGRKKPDIVAPGTHVSGGVAQQSAVAGGTGSAIGCFDGTGVSGGVGGANFFPPGQQFFSASSGTSHSTPGVAGGCALVRQWFVNQGRNAPTPAMIKAFLANSTRYMNGVGANDTLPSNNQGMGGMNLGMAFDGGARIYRDQPTNQLFTASGQRRLLTARVVSNNAPVRVTLAWTDAPGNTVGNAYNNNLDLVVRWNGQTYRGNNFASALSIAGGAADVRNNLESVFLPAGSTGVLVVTVNATSINSDGVPGNGQPLDQDFALVVYNAEEVTVPVMEAAGQAVTVDTCGVIHNGFIDPLELVTVRLALQNIGSAPTTNVVATLLPTGGVTAPSGPQIYGPLGTNGNSVTNLFTFIATGTCGRTLSATLDLVDGATALGTVDFEFELGTNRLNSRTTNNPTSIIVPITAGNGTPYPSSIQVSGTTGVIVKVTATLNGLAHTWPSDLDILLAGPNGQAVVLMSAAGDDTDVSGLSLTFDDDAASSLPSGAALSSGTYRPSDFSGGAVTFDGPAPAGPYSSELAVFDGLSPTGTWSLYVTDTYNPDGGNLAQGWRLNLTLGVPRCCQSNQPPELDPIGNKFVFHSNNLQFAVSAFDPADGHVITLSASNVPGGAQFFPTNGVSARGSFSWPFATNTPGTYPVTFYATDTNGTVSESIIVTILPAGVNGCGLILSEYIVGTANNRAIELYNGTGQDINLAASNAYLMVHVNNSPTIANSIALTGTIPANETYVIAHSSASTNLKHYAQQQAGGLTIDGNDAVLLRTGGTNGVIQDSMGDVGNNLNVIGARTTLVRRASVSSGDKNHTDNFTNAVQWLGFPMDTYTNLGTHTMTCLGGVQGPPLLQPVGNQVLTVSNSLVLLISALPTDSDTATLSVSNSPPGASFASTNENGTFTWTSAVPVGVYTTSFYAADNDGVSAETITINVQAYVPPATNVLVHFPFEDAASNFTRIAGRVTAGVVPSGFDSAAPSSAQPGNPLSALGSTGFTGAGDNFYEFSLRITAGRTLAVARVQFEDQTAGAGPGSWALRTSQDGFASDTAAGGTHLLFGTNDESLAVGDLTGLVTFRLYGIGAPSEGGLWLIDNFRLVGNAFGSGLTSSVAGLVITTASQAVQFDVTALAVGGVATPPVIGQLRWTNALTGGAGTTPAATNWLTPAIALDVGANLITVRGTNGAGLAVTEACVLNRLSAPQPAGPQVIYYQGFEAGDTWPVAGGTAQVSTAAGAGDALPLQRLRSGYASWQVSQLSTTLELAQVSIVGYTGRQVEVRLSAPALAAGSGVDSGDVVRVQVALDGAAFGAPGSTELAVRGDRQARWGYWTTNPATAGAGTTHLVPAPQSGTGSNHYGNLFLHLPDSATSVALRVWAQADAADELWCVDDLAVTGHALGGNDGDGDGMDDAWEEQHFGGTGVAGTGTDSDLDGLTDWAEFIAGTEPTNAASVLRAVAVSNSAASGWVVKWSSVTDRLYRLSRSTDLRAEFSGIASNLPGTPPLNTYTDVLSTNVLRAYRIEVQ